MGQRKSFYARHIAPRLVHFAYSADAFASMRERTIPRARGVVVEIGFGSGLNLPHYDPARVDRLIGIETDSPMMRLAEGALARTLFPVELRPGTAERIPLKDAVADTVVMTYALCAIAEPGEALQEIRRILKPSGRLLFCEHAAATGFCAKLQRGLDGVWSRLSAGRRLTRDPITTIMAAGFSIEDLAVRRFPARLMLFGMHYSGQARVQRVEAYRTGRRVEIALRRVRESTSTE